MGCAGSVEQDILLFSISFQLDRRPGGVGTSVQWEFAEETLSEINAKSKLPWLTVFGHAELSESSTETLQSHDFKSSQVELTAIPNVLMKNAVCSGLAQRVALEARTRFTG